MARYVTVGNVKIKVFSLRALSRVAIAPCQPKLIHSNRVAILVLNQVRHSEEGKETREGLKGSVTLSAR